jgi:hypothetical protein
MSLRPINEYYSHILAKIVRKLRPASNLCAVLVQEHRGRQERKTQEREHASSPLRTQSAVHVRCKQRKDGSNETAHESVRCQSRVCIEQVDVDEVDDGGHEDHDDLGSLLACLSVVI